jgi:DNA-binding transcriptional LysR family regulator
MHRRYEQTNIPIEIVRTFVCVVTSGSFSKAGDILALSQPAITGQMKRLQMLVGGAIFDRDRGGTVLTPRGTLVLTHAKKILEENDQLLLLGGGTSEAQPIRVGVPTVYADEFLEAIASGGRPERLTFLCGHTIELEKNFADGYLDIACVLHRPEDARGLIEEWTEDFVWVRSKNFVLSPGNPIPVISWPGSPQAQPAVEVLENNGVAYRVVFSSSDYGARQAAVAAGLGLMSMPKRQVKPPLVISKDYYLPDLPRLRVGLRVRKALPSDKVQKIVDLFRTLQPPAEQRQSGGAMPDRPGDIQPRNSPL